MPDYSRAMPLTWGRNKGCAFVTQSCMEQMEEAERLEVPSPFCSALMEDSERTYCTADRASVGSCNLVMYQVQYLVYLYLYLVIYKEELPAIYQNFREVDGVANRDVSKVNKDP